MDFGVLAKSRRRFEKMSFIRSGVDDRRESVGGGNEQRIGAKEDGEERKRGGRGKKGIRLESYGGEGACLLYVSSRGNG